MAENRKIELLSPAGGMAVLEAALEAGADAAYLGMKHFNAREGALFIGSIIMYHSLVLALQSINHNVIIGDGVLINTIAIE